MTGMSPTKTKDASAQPRRSATPATGAGDAPAPTITPEQLAVKPPGSNGTTGPGAPELMPPGTAAQAAADGMTVTTSATVGGLFTSNNSNNAWVFLNGVGWRRLSPANTDAHHALLEIARLAKDANIAVQCDEDGSVIHAMYVW
jgi:hypothetical protein